MSNQINRGDYLGAAADDTSIPALGTAAPKRGNGVTRRLASAILGLFGWRLAGRIPDVSKLVVVGAPHTSNWDWILVILAAYALGAQISWLAKHSLFRPPFGGFFRYLGGIPVDRRAAHGMVGEIIEAFQRRDKLMLCITPEGTRSKVQAWKKGFHHIAKGANVPIVLASFDYGRKVVGFGPTLVASGDIDADLQTIQALYAGVQAKQPQNF